MKVVPFIAETPAAALAQIHQQLGPDAVVVSVRPLPRQGLARLWPGNRGVEVLACVDEAKELDSAGEQRLPAGDLLQRLALSSKGPGESGVETSPYCSAPAALRPLHDGGSPHVFIGPPGTGKTTLLCKWMTAAVLTENRTARVWRLDGLGANTAEFLNVYGEMLGVPVERFWNQPPGRPALEPQGEAESGESGPADPDLLLIDLPGVPAGDAQALAALQKLLDGLPSPRLHLVLNAAYETPILARQLRAFAGFQPEDLSFTHLDEEQRQGKLLDFVLGTNCSLRFLSTGQKIPGDLVIAGAAARPRPEFIT